MTEFSELQKAYQAYKGKGVEFIGVFVRSSDDEIREFAKAYKLTFPVGKENGIAGLLGVLSIPTTVFIGKDGRIVKRHRGQITLAEIEEDIKTILMWSFQEAAMNKMFEEMMQKMMGGMMKPEDMPKMMDSMMEKIFKEMKTEDKMAFMENMMPRCMNMMFENMSPEDRKSFAEKMMGRMFSEMKKHAA